MFHPAKLVLSICAFAVGLVPDARADVRVVDGTGAPGTFATIQSACDASSDGDTVLVKSGTYPTFALVNRGITVSAYPGASVHVIGCVRIRSLSAGKTAVLIGLTITGVPNGFPDAQSGLAAASDHGHVRCAACSFIADLTPVSGSGYGAAGVLVDSCDDVELVGCNCSGGGGAPSFGSYLRGGAGLSAIASSVTLFNTGLNGGMGAPGTTNVPEGGSGGHGYQGRDSTLFASRVAFRGGNGGDGEDFGVICGQGFGGYGGNALHLDTTGDLVRLVDPIELPGVDGASYRSFCIYVPGTAEPARSGNGTFLGLPVSARSLVVSANPVHESTTVVASLTGIPGERVALIVSSTTASFFNPIWNGQQMFPSTLLSTPSVFVGVVPPGGTLNHPFKLPDLGPGTSSRVFFLQPLFGGSGGPPVLGSAVPLLALDTGI